MSSPSPDDADGILADLVQKFLEDRDAGALRGIEEYQALYPGFEAVVATEYESFTSDATRRPDSAAPPLQDRVGHYQLREEIGRGGQGIVFRARDERTGRDVALKLLHAWSSASPLLLKRFHREAIVAARLEDDGICRIFETGTDRGVPFMAMQFVPGTTLAHEMRSGGARTADGVRRFTRLIESVARSLHVAHESSVVHRDVKPTNIMVNENEQPVLLDFGLAHDDEALTCLTMSGDINGTLPYMAPEQLDAPSRDRRADVYSLGVTLFECVTGQRPHTGATRSKLLESIRENEPAAAHGLNAHVSRNLSIVIATAMAKDAAHRYVSARAFADDLRCILTGQPVAARPPGLLERCRRWSKRRPAQAALLLVLAIGLPALTAMGGFIAANMDSIADAKRRDLEVDVEVRLGDAYGDLARGLGDESLPAFEAALELLPDYEPAITGMVVALQYTGNPVGARRLLDASEVDSSMRSGLIALIEGKRSALFSPEASGAEQHFVAALAEQERATSADHDPVSELHHARMAVLLSSQPRARHHFALANVLHDQPGIGEARELAEAIVSLWPRDPNAWYWAGVAVHRRAPAEGVQYLERALAAAPDNVGALDAYAWCQLTLGNAQAAVTSLERAVAIKPTTVLRVRLAISLHESGATQAALEQLTTLLELVPNQIDALHLKARYLDHLERTAEAWEAWKACLRCCPDSSEAHRSMGSHHGRAGRFKQSLTHLKRAFELDPSPNANGLLGSVLLRSGRFEEAAEAFEAALAIDETEPNSVRLLPRALVGVGRYREAVPLARAAEQKFPGEYGHSLALARALRGQGRFEAAVGPYFRAWTMSGRKVLAISVERAVNLIEVGRTEDALDMLEDLQEKHAEAPAVLIPLARALTADDDAESALEQLQVALAIEAKSARAHLEKGRALEHLERWDESLLAYSRATDLDPEDAEAWLKRGRALLRSGRKAEAVPVLETAHRLGTQREYWPHDTAALLERAAAR